MRRDDTPERLTAAELLQRLRAIGRDLESSHVGVDLCFGKETPGSDVWLLFHRTVDQETADHRSAFCGTAPIALPRSAAAEFLNIAIVAVETEPLFNRANLQFRPSGGRSDEYLGFVELRSGMDYRIIGELPARHTSHPLKGQ